MYSIFTWQYSMRDVLIFPKWKKKIYDFRIVDILYQIYESVQLAYKHSKSKWLTNIAKLFLWIAIYIDCILKFAKLDIDI